MFDRPLTVIEQSPRFSTDLHVRPTAVTVALESTLDIYGDLIDVQSSQVIQQVQGQHSRAADTREWWFRKTFARRDASSAPNFGDQFGLRVSVTRRVESRHCENIMSVPGLIDV